MSLLADGRVLYQLKKRYRDGSTAVVVPPLVLLERLAALVPRPRRHLVTDHGVLAPAAAARAAVVPEPVAGAGEQVRHAALLSAAATGERVRALPPATPLVKRAMRRLGGHGAGIAGQN